MVVVLCWNKGVQHGSERLELGRVAEQGSASACYLKAGEIIQKHDFRVTRQKEEAGRKSEGSWRWSYVAGKKKGGIRNKGEHASQRDLIAEVRCGNHLYNTLRNHIGLRDSVETRTTNLDGDYVRLRAVQKRELGGAGRLQGHGIYGREKRTKFKG